MQVTRTAEDGRAQLCAVRLGPGILAEIQRDLLQPSTLLSCVTSFR